MKHDLLGSLPNKMIACVAQTLCEELKQQSFDVAVKDQMCFENTLEIY